MLLICSMHFGLPQAEEAVSSERRSSPDSVPDENCVRADLYDAALWRARGGPWRSAFSYRDGETTSKVTLHEIATRGRFPR